MSDIIKGLIDNSKSAAYSAIEIHNKPIFPYRYEVCTILIVNAWELILKAYIMMNCPEIKIIDKDGFSKPFDDCNDTVLSKVGSEFRTSYENLKAIYNYRCKVIHFYEDTIDILLFSLLSKNVILYYEFLLKHFGIDVSSETNLHLMPIGFKRPISPIDFLSNESEIKRTSSSVQEYVKSIVDSVHAMHKDGVDDSILLTYKMSVINENRIKNADIIAAITKTAGESKIIVENVLGNVQITNDSDARKVKVDEEFLYDKLYTETYSDVLKHSRNIFSDFSLNRKFHELMKKLKGNANFHKVRYLDIKKHTGSKDYYTKKVYEELGKHYKLN